MFSSSRISVFKSINLIYYHTEMQTIKISLLNNETGLPGLKRPSRMYPDSVKSQKCVVNPFHTNRKKFFLNKGSILDGPPLFFSEDCCTQKTVGGVGYTQSGRQHGRI